MQITELLLIIILILIIYYYVQTAKKFRKLEEITDAARTFTSQVNTIIESVSKFTSDLRNIHMEISKGFNKFVSLLTLKPSVRGFVGESLANIILSKLPETIFFRQVQIDKYKVDFAIELYPDGRLLPIDAKFTLPPGILDKEDLYVLTDKEIDEINKAVLQRANEVKKYIRPDLGTTNFAVMFIPDLVFYHLKEETWEKLRNSKIIPAGTASLLSIVLLAEQKYFHAKISEAAEKLTDMHNIIEKRIEETEEFINKALKQAENAINNIRKARETIENMVTEMKKLIGI